jgi:D-apiose dehydrogenase
MTTSASDLRFAIFGTGFWSRYQLAGWRELSGARCVALYNRTRAKAETLANEFGVPAVYDDPEELIRRERPDFIDIITDVDTHRRFVELAAAHKIPVICQKPMAPTLADCEAMAEACRSAGVPYAIHENWRWQRPLREFKKALESGGIGKVFRARIDYCNSFPVFENQPFLKDLEQFILTDIGSHILDVARFLFGEAVRVYCQTYRVHSGIRGEDVATVLMEMENGATVTCNMSYASRVEHDRFPETFVFAEGSQGSAELAPDYWVRVTTQEGTHARRTPPPFYPWADPRYALAQTSIVACNADILDALRTGGRAETHGEDNLKTMRLIFAAYESARRKAAVVLK